VRYVSSRFRFLRPWWLVTYLLLAAVFVCVRLAMERHWFCAMGTGGPAATADTLLTGGELYEKYCSVCHGANGDGQGIAARYCHPKARDLRTASFRLVSTENRVPSVADLAVVLEKGIPGTSMRSYGELSEAVRARLVDEVSRLRREGMREHVVRLLREELPDEEPIEQEVQQQLDLRLNAGPAVAVPAFSGSSPESVARGRTLFLTSACTTCHGDDATGGAAPWLQDDEGLPTRPRNLVVGEFKGGRGPASVYRRILLGLPGTPMPACPLLTDGQRMDLVHYCLSLSEQPQPPSNNYTRALATITRESKVLRAPQPGPAESP